MADCSFERLWFVLMDYLSLLNKIEKYKHSFDVKIIGKSLFGRNIFAVEKTLNKDFATAIFVASIHAREHITTDLLCKMIDEGLFDEIKNFNIVFVLMANPDGVELVTHGLESAPKQFQKHLLSMNNGSNDFLLWKANGRGVDLNNNFDACFARHVNSKKPASQGFVGEFAESEPESKALADFSRKIKLFLSISYHSKGEEIYYNFYQEKRRLICDEKIAQRFAKSTGYLIKNVEDSSSGGFKDFCIDKLNIAALTIEVGSDELMHPISNKYLDEIFEKHKQVAKDLEFAYNECRGIYYGL